jgi:hypothetical protein
MFWKLFDVLGFIFDVMDVFSSDFGLVLFELRQEKSEL